MRLIHRLLIFVLLPLVLNSAAAQDKRPTYKRHAQIDHQPAQNATVTADDPRPLWQAISALREEYGWAVSYEDVPITNPADLVDYTAPSWRAAHPSGQAYMIPRGGVLSSTFSETDVSPTANGEERILRTLVAEYNRAGHGKFEVRIDAPHDYFVVPKSASNAGGQEQSVTPILDTPISLPTATRTVEETLDLILNELSHVSGLEVILMSAPTSTLLQAQTTLGGTREPARVWLRRAFAATGRPIIWDLFFEPNRGRYQLSVYIAMKAVPQKNGQKWIVPIDRLDILRR